MGLISQLNKLASNGELNKAVTKSAKVFSAYTSLDRLLGRFFKTSNAQAKRELASKIQNVQSNPWDKSYDFRTKVVLKDGSVLIIDATTAITAEFPAKLTQYPVESGVTISDHVINQNPKFTLSAMWSDANAPSKGINSVGGTVKNAAPNKGLVPEKVDDSLTVYKKLLAIRDAREVVSLVTLFDTYTDLILTNISFPRSTGTGITVLVSELQFEKVRKVTSKVTTVYVAPKASSKTSIKTTPEKNAGSKATPPYPMARLEWDEAKLKEEIVKSGTEEEYRQYLRETSNRTESGGNAMGTGSQMASWLRKNSPTFNPSKYYKSN